MKNKNRIINEVNKIITEELHFLNGHYNYDLKKYYNHELIYAFCFLAFFNLEDVKNFSVKETIRLNNYYSDYMEKNYINADIQKILNLIAGFEILGIGINIHGSVENVINDVYPGNEKLIEDIDKNYTLELLFGDIFYSRALIYLLNYEDFFVFGDILNSLLILHYSRLKIHHKMIKINSRSTDDNIFDRLKKNISELKNLNALLKSAFLIGYGASNFKADFKELGICLRIIDSLVLFKTYCDIKNYLKEISMKALNNNAEEYLHFIILRKTAILDKVNMDIELIKPQWLKNNFSSIVKLFQVL